MTILDRARDALAAAYSRSGPTQEVLSNDILDFLLDIGLNLLKKCLARTSPEGVVAQVGTLRGRLMVRRAVAQALADQYGFGGFRRLNGFRMVNAVLTAAQQAKPNELAELATVDLEW